MSQPCATLGDLQFDLPPLILHPFNERIPPSTLLDNSKAALMLSGLIPSDGSEPEALQKRLLCGRYAEIRMLFFVRERSSPNTMRVLMKQSPRQRAKIKAS